LLLLVLLVGLVLGWRVNKARHQRLAVRAIHECGGSVIYDWECLNGKRTTGGGPGAPRWIRRHVGDEFFQEVVEVDFISGEDADEFEPPIVVPEDGGEPVFGERLIDDVLPLVGGLTGLRILWLQESEATDDRLANLRGLSRLEVLHIWNADELTDRGVAHLAGLGSLKDLEITDSKMTAEGLTHLARLARLESLHIAGSRVDDEWLARLAMMKQIRSLGFASGQSEITDGGLSHLSDLKGLEVLDIQGSRVTDRGLAILERLPNLKEVWIDDCPGISDEGIGKLKAARPGLRVVR
jgi:hypothetical protein